MPERLDRTEQNRDQLVGHLLKKDNKFRSLYKSHQKLEAKLEEIDRRPHLTTTQETERKKIQKMKLSAKDKMEAILQAVR